MIIYFVTQLLLSRPPLIIYFVSQRLFKQAPADQHQPSCVYKPSLAIDFISQLLLSKPSKFVQSAPMINYVISYLCAESPLIIYFVSQLLLSKAPLIIYLSTNFLLSTPSKSPTTTVADTTHTTLRDCCKYNCCKF
jgi:hypothetical protein